MRHALLVSSLLGLHQLAHAQTPTAPTGLVVSAGIYGFSPNAGVQLEQRLSRHFSVGLMGARSFSAAYTGYQAALLGRYYFRPSVPTGLYVQAQAAAFTSAAVLVADYPGYHSESATTLSGKGGGLGLGYQWLVKRHLVVAVGLGLKLYPTGLGICDCHYQGDWYAVGQPGSVLDGQLSFGYAL